jgi:hypothetical protein
MSAIAAYDVRRKVDARAKSRERSQGILSRMADQTARAHLPMCKRIDGWRVTRKASNTPLVVRDLKTGVVHAISTNTNPRKLSPGFVPPLVGG